MILCTFSQSESPLEISTSVDLGTDAFTPVLTSTSQDGCSIDLNAEQTWAQFRETCVPTESARNRISYNVHSQRDGVSAEFNGITLDFKRNVSESEVFRDGEGPADEDVLYEMTWTLTMSAPISNYIPSLLARGYRQRLSRRLRDAPFEAPRSPLSDLRSMCPIPSRADQSFCSTSSPSTPRMETTPTGFAPSSMKPSSCTRVSTQRTARQLTHGSASPSSSLSLSSKLPLNSY